MKIKNRDVNDALNRTHYSVMTNIVFCLKNTAHCHPSLLCWCSLKILIGTLIPMLTVFLPKTVIDMVTGKSGVQELIATVLTFMGSLAVLSGADIFLTKLIYHQKFRMNTFYLKRVAMKGLTTDYINQENGLFRKLQVESFACCNGNYSPLSGIYETLIRFSISLLGLAVFGTMLMQLHWGILAFLIMTTVISFFLNRRITFWTAANNQERIGYQQRLDYINRVSGDLRSAKDLRLYKMAVWFSDVYQSNMDGLAGWYKRLTRRLFGVAVYDSGLALLRESAVYLYLLYRIWNGQLDVAEFVLYFSVVTGFSAWLSDIFSQLSALHATNLKINYFRSYLEYPETFNRNADSPRPPAALPKTIELKNVSFRYEGAEHDTLRNINLKMTPGEHLAVVGLNGAGKTTLIKLICGLIDPTEGQVLYDGVDVREYNRAEFYRLFSAVFQQCSLLPMTVSEIVAETTAEHADLDRVKRCLSVAGLLDAVERLPDGLNSQFGKTVYDDGIEFSGGEIQKLLLARAMYRDAPVMLLDEPTAALDPIAESALYRNYNQISSGKTTVFVSHRLASTVFCDRILLIENGTISEEGRHDELLKQNGKYSALFEMQAKYYREKAAETEASI